MAEIVLPSPRACPAGWLGDMEGTVHILGDIVGPTFDPEDWAVLRGDDPLVSEPE